MKWFNNLNFKHKFFVVMGLIVVIMASFAVYIVIQVSSIQDDISVISGNQEQQVLLADAILESAAIIRNAVIVALGFVLLVVAVSVFTVNSFTRPTAELAKSLTEIANGDLTALIRSDRKDELGILTNCISDMIEKLSEHHKTEEALYKANMASQAKSLFLSHISHEIRTPMNAILGATEIQLQKDNNPPDLEEALGTIYDSGNLLLSIISDLLDFSKIEAGKLDLAPVEYDIASLVNDTMQLSLMRYDSKPIEFVLSIDEDTPYYLCGDVLRIKQILNNILSNAFKYTEKGKVELSIYTECSKDTTGTEAGDRKDCLLVIRISDTGYGLTEEQIDLLFEEYSRFHHDVNYTTVGTGLGMTITKSLVDLMDGEILVESVPGEGSVFTVKLPQECSASAKCGPKLAAELDARRYRSQSKSRRAQVLHEYMPYGRILIVDDVGSNLYVAKGIMLPYGMNVDTANSGYEAIGKIKNGAVYDVVFMDYMMPKMDGLETINVIRDMGYTNPIVILTANVVKGQAELFLNSGCDDYMHKPIDIRELNAMLNRLVRDKQPPEVIEAARQEQKNRKGSLELDSAQKSHMHYEFVKAVVQDAGNAIIALDRILQRADALSDADISLFTTTVHGMKSPLAELGETELSNNAYRLEQKGCSRNISAIVSETPVFINDLRLFIEKSKPERTGNVSGISRDDITMLKVKLGEIKKACEEYDIRTVKSMMTGLKRREWPDALEDKISEMAWDLTRGDYDKVAYTAWIASELSDTLPPTDE